MPLVAGPNWAVNVVREFIRPQAAGTTTGAHIDARRRTTTATTCSATPRIIAEIAKRPAARRSASPVRRTPPRIAEHRAPRGAARRGAARRPGARSLTAEFCGRGGGNEPRRLRQKLLAGSFTRAAVRARPRKSASRLESSEEGTDHRCSTFPEKHARAFPLPTACYRTRQWSVPRWS